MNFASEACVRATKAFFTTLFSIALLQCAPVLAGASKRAPPAIQAEFNGFRSKFAAALKADDAAAVAGMTRLPFMGDAGVSDAAQFRAKTYKDNFFPKARACLQRGAAVYDHHENNDNFSISCGDSIFTFTKTPAGFLLTDIDAND
jgi:hypothetical protein